MNKKHSIIDRFSAHGKQYEVRLSCDGTNFKIRVFCDDRPANGLYYTVSLESQGDAKIVNDQDLVKDLANMAKNDVIDKKYEKLLEWGVL